MNIEKAALELYKVYGVKNVSMSDVASRCGVSKKTVYERYGSKEDLVAVVLEEIFTKLHIRLNYISNKTTDTLETILCFYVDLMTYCKSFHPVFLYSLHKYYPESAETYQRQVTQLVEEKICPVFLQAKKGGVIREDVDEALVCELHVEHFHYLVFRAFTSQVRFDIPELFMRRIVPAIRGLLTKEHYDNLDIVIARCQTKITMQNGTCANAAS